ncbi:hypothetical protein [Mycobacterium ostraviense]|nr:hypothetical protein [Mycobacterium ostraviense]
MPVGPICPAGAGAMRPVIGFLVDERRRAVNPLTANSSGGKAR